MRATRKYSLLSGHRSCGGVYNDVVEAIDGCENYLYTCMWETAVTADQASFLQQTSGVLSSAIFSSTNKHSHLDENLSPRRAIERIDWLLGCGSVR